MRLVAILLSALFYGALAFGTIVYGSYRYEPSGVQYFFLPFLAAPIGAITVLGFSFLARRGALPKLLIALPCLAVAILILPGLGMLLSDRNLELARWGLIAIGCGHAVTLIWFLLGNRLGERPA